VQPDDAQWRRPSDAEPGKASVPSPDPSGSDSPSGGPPPTGPPGTPYPGLSYQGPPAMAPPPSGWRPPRVFRLADPRRLPAQDHARIDAAEARARTVTLGVGIVVGAIFVVTICALCARVVL
jgi:hypothetical protein